MVVEVVTINVNPDETGRFEETFHQAKQLISPQPGFISLELHKGVENSERYVLLVHWERIEDHLEGFRNSPEIEKWRDLLNPFYSSAPAVEHFTPVISS